MKTYLLTLMCLPLFLLANTTDKEIFVPSEVTKATVFLRGAQVFRNINVTIPKGQQTVVFEDVESQLNTSSIQVSGLGDFLIMDMKVRKRYVPAPKPDSIPRLIKLLNRKVDTQSRVTFDRDYLSKQAATLNQERALIVNSPLIKGTALGDSLELLKNTAKYLRKQLFELDSLLIVNSKEQRVVGLTLNRLQQEINELNLLIQQNRNGINATRLVNDIVVKVVSEKTLKANLELSYLISNASWYPEYDIKASAISQPLKLTYKARVNQQTGKDWNNVDLTFSTNDPIDGKTKPILVPWNLSFYVPQPMQVRGGRADKSNVYLDGVSLQEVTIQAESVDEDEFFKANTAPPVPAQNAGSVTVESQQLVNTEFKLDIPYSVPSNNEQNYLMLKEYDLPATYSYIAVPKRNKFAYLMASVGDWKDIHLLPSSANLYYGGTYIGRAFIDPNTFTDSLRIGLGQDKKVIVERCLKTDETKNETFTGYRVRTFDFEYKVSHQGKQAIPLIIEDQIPISRLEEIEIKLVDGTKKPELNEEKGFTHWRLTLKPGEKEEWRSGFSIRYPKDKQLAGL